MSSNFDEAYNAVVKRGRQYDHLIKDFILPYASQEYYEELDKLKNLLLLIDFDLDIVDLIEPSLSKRDKTIFIKFKPYKNSITFKNLLIISGVDFVFSGDYNTSYECYFLKL